jgi:hypothetical protein
MPYNNIIYATEQEARSYLIPYGTQMLFMDPTAPTFYVKTTDAFGSPSFDVYDFTPRSSSTQAETPLTRADLESLRAEILALLPQNQPQEVPHDNAQSNNAQ